MDHSLWAAGRSVYTREKRLNVQPELTDTENLSLNEIVNKCLALNRRGLGTFERAYNCNFEKLNFLTFEYATGTRYYDSVIPECYTSKDERFFGKLKLAQSRFSKNTEYDVVLSYVNNNENSDNLTLFNQAFDYYSNLSTNNEKYL